MEKKLKHLFIYLLVRLTSRQKKRYKITVSIRHNTYNNNDKKTISIQVFKRIK